jgi:hypothetical protein
MIERSNHGRNSPVTLEELRVVTHTFTRSQASVRTIAIISGNKFLALISIANITIITFAFISKGAIVRDAFPHRVAFVIHTRIIGASKITFAFIQTCFICSKESK